MSGRFFKGIFSNCYVYVLPSDIEGMPIILLEAMSYSRCCLVSGIPENVSVIKNGVGFSFTKSSAVDLRDALGFLPDTPDVVKETGIRAADESQK